MKYTLIFLILIKCLRSHLPAERMNVLSEQQNKLSQLNKSIKWHEEQIAASVVFLSDPTKGKNNSTDLFFYKRGLKANTESLGFLLKQRTELLLKMNE